MSCRRSPSRDRLARAAISPPWPTSPWCCSAKETPACAARPCPRRLGPKEGLALINGTQLITAVGTLALLEAEELAAVADIAGACTLEALKGSHRAFDPRLHALRPHRGQV